MNANEAIRWIHSRTLYRPQKRTGKHARAARGPGKPRKGFFFPCTSPAPTARVRPRPCALPACKRAATRRALHLAVSGELSRAHPRERPGASRRRRFCAGVREIMAACASLEERGVSPTTFEIGTALAFWHFREMGAQVAVVECGLGGAPGLHERHPPIVSMICRHRHGSHGAVGRHHRRNRPRKGGDHQAGRSRRVVMRQSEEILNICRGKGRDHRRRSAGACGDHPLRQPLSPAVRRIFHPPARAASDAQRLFGALWAACLGPCAQGPRSRPARGRMAGAASNGWETPCWTGRTTRRAPRTLREYLEEHFPGAGMDPHHRHDAL